MNIEAIITQCSNSLKKYNCLDDKNNNIDELLTILDKLSGYVFFLREAVGNAEANYITLKTTCEIKRIEGIKAKMHDKAVISKLEREVEYDTLADLYAYRQEEAIHVRLKNIVIGVERTIDAIDHRINFYKFDKKTSNYQT